MKNTTKLYSSLLLSLTFIILCSQLISALPGFVTVNGNNFYLNNKPFYFAGTNAYYLWYGALNCSAAGVNQGCVIPLLDTAKAMNLTVIRTWGASEGFYKYGYCFQPSAGVYNEATFAHFDRVVKEAGDRNLKLIVSLTNNWNDFGGMNAYVYSWCGLTAHDEFYNSSCPKQLYKNYIAYFLNRTNTLTGVKYKDDPTIMAWELANEPRSTDKTCTNLNNWIGEMSAYIKSIDSNHLVTTGEEGGYKNKSGYSEFAWWYKGNEGQDFIANHNWSTVDFATFHYYSSMDGTINPLTWITEHVSDAHNILRKPILFEEFNNLANKTGKLSEWYNLYESLGGNGDTFWMLADFKIAANNDGYFVFCPENASECNTISKHANYMNNLTNSWPENCIVPTDGKVIISDTDFCPGSYYLPSGMNISASNIIVDCHGAKLNGRFMNEVAGLSVRKPDNVLIKNCVINGYYYGIFAWDSNNNLYTNNLITNNTQGIYFDNCYSQTVSNNRFINNSVHGLYAFWNSIGYVIDKNIFEGNTYGITLDWDVHNSVVKNNVVKGGQIGIYSDCRYGDKPAYINNYTNNTVTGTTTGMYFCLSGSNYIEKNKIMNNYRGLYYSKSSNNFAYHNNFLNNTFQIVPGDPNNWSVNGEGNYWSSYDTPAEGCDDADSNGICDAPYVLNVNNTDYYPLTSAYTWTDITCTKNSDCGTDSNVGKKYCSENNLTQDSIIYTCNNPNTTSSYCSSTVNSKVNKTCTYGCEDNGCNPAPISRTEFFDLMNTTFKVHMNYFLSNYAVTSYGLPLTAYKTSDRARFGYSNPTEWGYLLQAYIAGSERNAITQAAAIQKVNTSLNTMLMLQNDSNQTYRSLFYPYYKVTGPSPGLDVKPYRDTDVNIPSIDNGLLYMSLLITEGWAKDIGNSEIELKARTIKDRMNFSIFLQSSGYGTYMSHTVNANTGFQGSSVWNVYSDEGGLMSLIAYLSKSVNFETFRSLTNNQSRTPASWNGYTVSESAWFNSMFAWGVRSIAGIDVEGSPYSKNSLVPTTRGQLSYGNYLGVSYPGFSDAMSQGLVGYYVPPNMGGVTPGTGPSAITPHAFFIPLNVLDDLDNNTISKLADNIKRLQRDSGGYYFNSSTWPFGFVVGASPYENQYFAGIVPIDGRMIFETLSHGYVTLSLFNALQTNGRDFAYFAGKVSGYSENLSQATEFLYPGYCIDADGDNYNSNGKMCGKIDCNDNNGGISPISTEILNGVDDDCDGLIDEGLAQNKTIMIVNGKITINGSEFLVKGMNYAPWLEGTGPEPSYNYFPNQNDDVTELVDNLGQIFVRDYNGNGRIETQEVIQQDLETMKAQGVNTIRIYASGDWHDMNLNDVQDSGERVKGDMPDWVIDQLLNYSNANGMKVIIGYWVQDEDLIGTPLVCNWTDLEIAKKTFGRVVAKYKDNPAVLGWAIGNEVHGSWNHAWFSWGVDINSYLNQLYAHARTVDGGEKPIIYSKYVGESAGFSNLNADIIAVNAGTNTAATVSGQFVNASSNKAYLVGEYGDILSYSDSLWSLSKQHAGGAFLEYNNVWWKTGGTNFGTVTMYRENKADRYGKVLYLYKNQTANCYSNSDCGNNTWLNAPFCNGTGLWDYYKTYTCNNPATTSASCSQNQSLKLLTNCAGNCSGGACVNNPAGLLFYEPFESQIGVSANGGVFQNVGSTLDSVFRTGKIGNALEMRNNEMVNFPINAPELRNGTIEFIFKNFEDYHGLLELDGQGGWLTRNYAMAFVNRHAYLEIGGGQMNSDQTLANSTWIDTNWHHAVLSWKCGTNSSTFTMYIDGIAGQAFHSNVCPNANMTAPLSLIVGSSTHYGTGQAAFDELKVFNYSKNQSQALDSYSSYFGPMCTTNLSCGINVWRGSKYCSGGNVWDHVTEYTCSNPGTSQALCSDTYRSKLNQTCANGCFNGTCNATGPIVCSTNSQCGTNGWVGNNYCSSGNVWDGYRTYWCNNPNTTSSFCSNLTINQSKQNCTYGCTNGVCNSNPGNSTNCTVPTTGMIINSSVNFCPGTYNIAGIQFGRDNITATCNGTVFSSSSGILFTITNRTNITLQNCRATTYNYHVSIASSKDISIKNNSFTGAWDSSVSALNSRNVRIEENILAGSEYKNGVYFENTSLSLIKRNTINASGFSGSAYHAGGIAILASFGNNLTENVITGNIKPMYLTSATQSIFSKNRMCNNNNNSACINSPNFGEYNSGENLAACGAWLANKSFDCSTGCADSDSGVSEFVFGGTRVWNGATQLFNEDSCSSGTVLSEKYCSGGISQTQSVTCGSGCLNGACNSCTPNLVNTSWSNWLNVCTDDGLINQSRYLVQYDANNCGTILNRTIYEYNLTGCEQLNQTCFEGSCADVTCFVNGQCGVQAWQGQPFCSGINVADYWIIPTCINPGTAQSYCSDNSSIRLKQNCTYGCTNGTCNAANQTINCSFNSQCGTNSWIGSNYCNSGNVWNTYRYYYCSFPGTINSFCWHLDLNDTRLDCSYGCTNGTCNAANQTINCSTNTQCGTNGWIGSNYCSGGNVWNTYETYTCNNPGTISSYCSSSNANQSKETCSFGCLNGVCQNQTITPISVVITSPTSGSTYSSSTKSIFNISGNAEGTGLNRVALKTNLGEIINCSLAGGAWTCANVELLTGANALTVTAYDSNGNKSSDTLTITFTSAYPKLDDNTMRAGMAIQEINMNDNIVPGSVQTIRWKILSYYPLISSMKVVLPSNQTINVNGKLIAVEQGRWKIGDRNSKIFVYEANWSVPQVPGNARVRFQAALNDGYAYMSANVPGGVDSRPYLTDGKEVLRTITSGGTSVPIFTENTTINLPYFDTLDKAIFRAGGTITRINVPDNVARGSTVKVSYDVLSYAPLISRFKVRLMNGTEYQGDSTLTNTADGRWSISTYRSKVYTFEYNWIVPNEPGEVRVRFMNAQSDGYAYMNGNIPGGVDSRPYLADGKEVLRTIV